MMKKVFEEMALYNENYMLGAERVFKYRKIKYYLEGDFLKTLIEMIVLMKCLICCMS